MMENKILGYMVFVSRGSKPKVIHETYEKAFNEAERLQNLCKESKVLVFALLKILEPQKYAPTVSVKPTVVIKKKRILELHK